ncbi:MAG: tRNA (adenosine(37)-N6)-threonylcarbamoyltransferase complex dimerization subunit type 1 TsaB [Calditrichaeota bacterium]|nr:tRNA (adenosine(37)-N6)-threonylcarbamoyltransferase complex dimerization subunit type 1 TsaB [Calditrichota bacterium]
MKLLAIDTATETGSVAFLEDSCLQAEYRIRRKRIQSRKLVPVIQSLLADLEWDFSDISGVAVSIGPGSFTGLRIGLSVAKGIAFARGLPLTSVISLDALALSYAENPALVCPMIRFRKQDYYLAMYRWDGTKMERMSEYEVLDVKELNDFLVDGTTLTGDFSEEEIDRLRDVVKKDVRLAHPLHRQSTAFQVGLLGQENFRQGKVDSIDRVEPFYLRDFPIKQPSAAGVKKSQNQP